MKKSMKFMTVLLTLSLLLQTAPLAAMGDSANAETYNGAEQNEDQIVHTDTSADEGDTQTASVRVTSVQWQSLADAGQFFVLEDGGAILANHFRLRIYMSSSASSFAASVDGVTVEVNHSGNLATLDLELLNGAHTLSVVISDSNGFATYDMAFTVDGDTAYPSMSFDLPDGINLGETKAFSIHCANLEQVESFSINIALTRQLKVRDVVISDGLTGSYIWYRGELKFNLRVVDPAAIQNGVLVTFNVNAPLTMKVGDEIYWNVESAGVTLKEGSTVGNTDDFVNSFDAPDVAAPIGSVFTVSGESFGLAGNPYTVTVTDQNGASAADIAIYAENGKTDILLGNTDENGVIDLSELANGSYEIYALSEEGFASARHTFAIYDAVGSADGAPYAILNSGLVKNGKTITWMSHYLGSAETACALISTNPDMTDAIRVDGQSTVTFYETTQGLNRVNKVTLEDLIPGTVYYYCVGDGRTWSDVTAFTAKTEEDAVNIAIFGDMTGASADAMTLIGNAIAESGVDYDFGIRVGDLIGGTDDHDALVGQLAALKPLGSLDMIHTDDNTHRGDALSESLLSYGEDYASYVYGNVFVAVINATADASVLAQNLNQMSIDAKTSGTKWQILSVRESAYTTESEQANKILESLLPEAAELGGIDLVVSAAECNYARTDALREGQATEQNGVIYMICGSAAKKNAVENAEGFAVTSDSYNALYVSVSATADTLSVRTYNVLADGAVEEIDSLERRHFVCEDGTHIYRYGQDPDGDLICDICDHTRSLDNYVGILAMSDFYMYYIGGGFYRGWANYGGNTYFFDRSMFVAVDGEQVIDGNTFVFKDHVLVEGAWIEEDGVRKLLWGKDTLKSTWHEQAGVTYYFLEDGAMATGTVEIESVNENGETVVETYLFDENGALIGKQ